MCSSYIIAVYVVVLFALTEASNKKGLSAYAAELWCDDFNVLNNMKWW